MGKSVQIGGRGGGGGASGGASGSGWRGKGRGGKGRGRGRGGYSRGRGKKRSFDNSSSPGWRGNSSSSSTSSAPPPTKGQLISKCPYEIIVSSKIPTKLFLDFCPEIFCTFMGASWKLFGAFCRLSCL